MELHRILGDETNVLLRLQASACLSLLLAGMQCLGVALLEEALAV